MFESVERNEGRQENDHACKKDKEHDSKKWEGTRSTRRLHLYCQEMEAYQTDANWLGINAELAPYQ